MEHQSNRLDQGPFLSGTDGTMLLTVRNLCILLTGAEMTYLAQLILKQTEALAEGTPISAKLLLGLGSRAGIDQALSRLHRRGELLRIARGLYVRPVQGKFGKRAPAAQSVVAALSFQQGETMAHSPASAANSLGLTTQMPIRTMFVTSGRTRKLHLGKQCVELQHAPHWQLLPGTAGEILRALAWAGKAQAGAVLAAIAKALPGTQIPEAFRYAAQLPGWAAQALSAHEQYV